MTRDEFVSCVETGQKAFRRFLTGLCGGDAELADDVAQEAYIKAFLARESLTDVSKFKSWVYRIGVREFLNWRRTPQPATRDVPETADSTVADEGFRYQHLYAALGRLSERERTAILLHYMEGYAVAEIAEMIDASQGAVKQYLHRGRVHLSGLIER